MINMDETFKTFDNSEAKEWGTIYYGNWLIRMQDQKHLPITPQEIFFRYYTQGAHQYFNRALRNDCDIEKYCKDTLIEPETFYAAMTEIRNNPINENVITYRFIERSHLKKMLLWSNQKRIKKNAIIFDKGFLSTTLTPYEGSVMSRHYAIPFNTKLIIRVPKGTPCAYMDLISDMDENELLFLPMTRLKILSKSIFNLCIECMIV